MHVWAETKNHKLRLSLSEEIPLGEQMMNVIKMCLVSEPTHLGCGVISTGWHITHWERPGYVWTPQHHLLTLWDMDWLVKLLIHTLIVRNGLNHTGSQFNCLPRVSVPRQQAGTPSAAAATHANGWRINDTSGFALVHSQAELQWIDKIILHQALVWVRPAPNHQVQRGLLLVAMRTGLHIHIHTHKHTHT